MKKIYISVCVCILLSVGLDAQSQTAENAANQIAQRMKDSLSLTDQQKNAIAANSINLENHKANLKSRFPGTSSLPYYLKELENIRDSIYRTILPADKYHLYKQKKGI